jgi:hypothetical protein
MFAPDDLFLQRLNFTIIYRICLVDLLRIDSIARKFTLDRAAEERVGCPFPYSFTVRSGVPFGCSPSNMHLKRQPRRCPLVRFTVWAVPHCP